MTRVKLSKRLQLVADFVPRASVLADIGSDHGHLPLALVLEKKIARAICGEVIIGPFKQTVDQVEKFGLQAKVTVRLADGLLAIEPSDEVSAISICGMGGKLITEILEAGKARIPAGATLILQANVAEEEVRAWLANNFFEISEEAIIKDHGKIYEVMVARPVAQKINLTPKELLFGPHLMAARTPLFLEKWRHQLAINQTILNQYQNAQVHDQEKITYHQELMTLIAEVLDES